ncbi:MAG: glutaredoxin [Calditrichaeota bacterium]|nr:MAG: glutaredoxin [Calditrichota bacterium]
MALIQEKDREEIRKRFAKMTRPVKFIMFTQDFECDYCKETRQILEELAELSDKLTLEVHDFIKDKELAEKYHVDKIPATVIEGEKDYGIRFYGIPSGYEFATLIEDVIMVSNGDSMLSPESREKLKALQKPVHIQVFVTPTCPYCPRAVFLAHQFAMESDKVTADMVEATEFPHLANRYEVMGVPKTVANDRPAAEGALPEPHFLDHILNAIEQN